MKYKYFFFLVVAFCSTALLLSGCSSDVSAEGEALTQIDLPRNVAAPSWRIVYSDGTGQQGGMETKASDAVFLSLRRNAPAAVLAYPVGGAAEDKPFGAIYPFCMTLNAQDGFVASILLTMYNPSDFVNTPEIEQYILTFNWQKLAEQCGTFEDPWLLNEEKIITAIRSGKFRKSDVKIDKKKTKK